MYIFMLYVKHAHSDFAGVPKGKIEELMKLTQTNNYLLCLCVCNSKL